MSDSTSAPPPDVIEVRIGDSIKLAVPATLDSITTYVLLEQERWFEKEPLFMRHWLKPGMTVIDIGASVGIYGVLMARQVGAQGRVFAYEPASEPRTLLEHNRILNDVPQLKIIPRALSSGVREGFLTFGASSEVNALGEGDRGECVQISCLDFEDAELQWPAPDLVKIDVEGEEEAVLQGGRLFFERYSPLVMFEIKSGNTFKESLRTIFPSMGYRLYRQIGSAPILVPLLPDETIDPFEMNAFAVKPDRAAALARDGFLLDKVGTWLPDAEARQEGLRILRRRTFAKSYKQLFAKDVALDPAYRDALAAYAVWRDAARSVPERCAALQFALHTMRRLCEQAPTIERLSTMIRIASEWGAIGESRRWATQLVGTFQHGPPRINEPFWPAWSAFEGDPAGTPPDIWIFAAAVTHIEKVQNYSSMFTGATATLSLACNLPGAPIEMERRRTLIAAAMGQRPKVPARLRVEAQDHLNARLWAMGKVPGTALESVLYAIQVLGTVVQLACI